MTAACAVCSFGACAAAEALAALKVTYRAWRAIAGTRFVIENRACVNGGSIGEAEVCTAAVATVAII